MAAIKKIFGGILVLIIIVAAIWYFWVRINQPLFYGEGEYVLAPVPKVLPPAAEKQIAEKSEKEADETVVIKEKQAFLPVDSLAKTNPAPKTVLNPGPPVIRQSETPDAGNQIILTGLGVVLQTNVERRNRGISELFENRLLDAVAQKKVEDMFLRQYFEHTSPQGLTAGDLAVNSGYEYLSVGENLAMGDFESDADLVGSWMASPGHRENILKAGFKEIGVAVKYGMYKGRMTWMAVQEFGTPASACLAVDKTIAAQIDAAKISLDNFSKMQTNREEIIAQGKIAAQTLEDELNQLIAHRTDDVLIFAKQSELKAAAASVNKQIDDYNAAIQTMEKIYAGYKLNIETYNRQVEVYNACLAKLK